MVNFQWSLGKRKQSSNYLRIQGLLLVRKSWASEQWVGGEGNQHVLWVLIWLLSCPYPLQMICLKVQQDGNKFRIWEYFRLPFCQLSYGSEH